MSNLMLDGKLTIRRIVSRSPVALRFPRDTPERCRSARAIFPLRSARLAREEQDYWRWSFGDERRRHERDRKSPGFAPVPRADAPYGGGERHSSSPLEVE